MEKYAENTHKYLFETLKARFTALLWHMAKQKWPEQKRIYAWHYAFEYGRQKQSMQLVISIKAVLMAGAYNAAYICNICA